MGAENPQNSVLLAQSRVVKLPDVLESIGSDRFDLTLLAFLHRMCGADHFAVFQMGNDTVTVLASGSFDGSQAANRQAKRFLNEQYWRKDPTISEGGGRLRPNVPIIVRSDIEKMVDTDLRNTIYPHVCDRVLICGRRCDAPLGLSLLRSNRHGGFREAEFGRLTEAAELLISILAKHAEMLESIPTLSMLFASVGNIENGMIRQADFPRRELQVCARILFGMSSAGIAIDLGIGEESVKTYRKRAYRRLNIGCERELMAWYLTLWSDYRGSSHAASLVRPLSAGPVTGH